MYFDGAAAVALRAVDDQVEEVVVVVELGSLAEILGVLDRQWVEVERVGQQVAAFGVEIDQVEPEERARRDLLSHRIGGGVGQGAVDAHELPLHGPILVAAHGRVGDPRPRDPPPSGL